MSSTTYEMAPLRIQLIKQRIQRIAQAQNTKLMELEQMMRRMQGPREPLKRRLLMAADGVRQARCGTLGSSNTNTGRACAPTASDPANNSKGVVGLELQTGGCSAPSRQ
jgi:hypothetical protein